ncbi:MAG: hypothetical protein Ta2D_04170 [Rickettsiales bacterium]|nr:MAG: hypothetical protein Ta2D_04170 [Rickettsiales bacterium]
MSEKNISNNTSYTDFLNNVIVLLKNADKNRINITSDYADKMHEQYEYEKKQYGKSDIYKDEVIIKNISEIYKNIGNKVEHKEIGIIFLTNKTIDDTITHEGYKTNLNIEALYNAALLFKNAKILNYTENWKNRGYDSYLCACPIMIKDKNYIAEMVVNRYHKGTEQESQRGYIVNIIEQKELDNYLSNPKNTHNSEHHLPLQKVSSTGTIITEPVFLINSIIIDTLQKVKLFL